MSIQSEAILEEKLLVQLSKDGYVPVVIPDEDALVVNLKTQLEKHNQISFSDDEFKKVMNFLSKGNIFEKAKTLRDKFVLQRDDGSQFYVGFLDSVHWCQNRFQVTSQVTMGGTYKNRYDVTILINGLPLVQVELKRRGLELKEAFNQTLRYKRHTHSHSKGLFGYVQLFVISKSRYLSSMEKLREARVVFIFDECHRSQFGETHTKINKFFTNNQMIGFTGTPIFTENAIGKRTTADLFSSPALHKYVITDAINDENVLKFSIEYVGKYKEKEGVNNLDIDVVDIDVEELDTKEPVESEDRLDKITDYIIVNHARKTHSKTYTAMMAVGFVEKFYDGSGFGSDADAYVNDEGQIDSTVDEMLMATEPKVGHGTKENKK